MSEQNNDSLYQKQKAVKPKIEDVAGDFVTGDNLKNLQDFLGFLKDNKLTPQWQSSNSWKVSYKSKSVCYIRLNDKEKYWSLDHSQFTREKWFTDYDKYITDAGLKEFVLEHINAPRCTGRECKGRQNMTILGKKFDEVCNCWSLSVKAPGGAELEDYKKFILVIKKFIVDLSAVKSKA
jgi:hypothetical protein